MAGSTARNRSAQACASVTRSTGSLPGDGGLESNRASESMSSTSWRSRRLSPWMPVSASRYSAALRGLLRATSASALITLSGVRSSCEASAVNSSWRRRDCSTGARARRPTTSEPPNMASRRNRPAMTSPYSSSRSVCASPARLWPATSSRRHPGHLQPERSRRAEHGRDPEPVARLVPGNGRRQRRRTWAVSRDRSARVQRPQEDRRRIGVNVVIIIRVPAGNGSRTGHWLAEDRGIMTGLGQVRGQAVAALLRQVGGYHKVQHRDGDDVDDGDDRRSGGGNLGRVAAPHVATIR